VMMQGVPTDLILELGFVEFDSLHGSCERNVARHRIEETHSQAISQVGGKEMKKYLAPYHAIIDPESSGPKTQDDFDKDFEKGIR